MAGKNRAMKKFLKVLGLIIVLGAGVFMFGSRPDISQNVTFNPQVLPADLAQLDTYVANNEKAYSDIRPGNEKRLIWANPLDRKQTNIAFVYIHGFSASPVETAPLTENLARSWGANAFMTRLSGHGRTGEALAEPDMSDWLNDVSEAIEIGSRLGKKVILLSGSTGGTLSTWAATRPELSSKIAGMAMISPNYALMAASTTMLNMPWSETLLPMIFGQTRTFEPGNDLHANGWTHSYPSKAIFPMAALLRVVDAIDYSTIKTPALFIYSDDDSVVSPERTSEVIAKWGAPTEVFKVSDSTDPNHHVLAGDALSPNTTGEVAMAISNWLRNLK
jgi:alpha-beta hydrolase superfamily lysophospholipase